MWEVLKHSHIDQARHELQTRLAAVLQRQARELEMLERERDELDALVRLAAIFSRKFARPSSPPAPVVQRVTAEPAVRAEPVVSRVMVEPVHRSEPTVTRIVTAPAPPQESVVAVAIEPVSPEAIGSVVAVETVLAAAPTARQTARRTAIASDASEDEVHPRHRRRRHAATNFDMFWRAIEKSSF